MKWTNPGHQLDDLGERYLKVKNLYIWGTDETSEEAYNFLKWVGVLDEFNIYFVRERMLLFLRFVKNSILNRKVKFSNLLNILSLGKKFRGEKVVSRRGLFAQLRNSGSMDHNAIAIDSRRHVKTAERLKKMSMRNVFYLSDLLNKRDNFIQNFVCVWLMYKHSKLLSHNSFYLTTNRCNLNCEGCLNFTEYRADPRDIPFDVFKKDIDLLFSKFDYLYFLQLSGGEPLLTKNLQKYIRYIGENYRDRVFKFFIITNSTIIPNEEILEAVKSADAYFVIDDYSDSVQSSKLNDIVKVLDRHNICYTINKAAFWVDLDVFNTDNSNLSEEEMVLYRDGCNTYCNSFIGSKFVACNFLSFALNAGIIDSMSENDYIDMTTASKMEILEFRLGYTRKGYLDFCKRCKGIGKNAKIIPVAVQVPRTKKQ